MFFKTKEKDPNRWHRRFAFIPVKINGCRVWLEWYSYRKIEEPQKNNPMIFDTFREYCMANGRRFIKVMRIHAGQIDYTEVFWRDTKHTLVHTV